MTKQARHPDFTEDSDEARKLRRKKTVQTKKTKEADKEKNLINWFSSRSRRVKGKRPRPHM